MVECKVCNKSIWFFQKKCKRYKGKKKGYFGISNKEILCMKCFLGEKNLPNRLEVEELGKLSTYVQEQKYKEALVLCDKLFNKHDYTHWYNKGNIYRGLGKLKESMKCYDEALFLNTHYVKAWYRKGETLYEIKKYKEAGHCFDNVIEIEKPKMKNVSFVVEHSEKGMRFNIHIWSYASMLHRAFCFIAEKKNDQAYLVFETMFDTFGDIPPFDTVEEKDYIEFCTTRVNDLLGLLEPEGIIVIRTGLDDE